MGSHQTNCYPPIYHHGSPRRISPADALAQISTYLALSTTNPYLHPDAHITPQGPQFSSSAGAGGIVLNLLRRVEKGLQGERLGGEVESDGLEFFDGGRIKSSTGENVGGESEAGKGKKRKLGGEEGCADVVGGDTTTVLPEDPVIQAEDDEVEAGRGAKSEWLDPEEYWREQEQDALVEDEIGRRNNHVDAAKIRDRTTAKDDGATGRNAAHKEARKRDKKERKKLEKEQREMERKAKKAG